MATIGPDQLASLQQWMTEFYALFDQDRSGKDLIARFRPLSMLTYESASVQGVDAIAQKLKELPFSQGIRHQIGTLDAQPGPVENTMVVLITGQLIVDEEQRPMNFTETFFLGIDGSGVFILNDIFKLIYG